MRSMVANAHAGRTNPLISLLSATPAGVANQINNLRRYADWGANAEIDLRYTAGCTASQWPYRARLCA
jgi:hypothetical protein